MADVDAFFSRLNPLMRLILRSPLHWAVSSGLALITVTGRRTGQRYTIPVGYQRDGDVIVIMVSQAARKQWWRNFREPGHVELLLQRKLRGGEATLVSHDDPSFRPRFENALRRVPGLGRAFGIHFHASEGLTDAQLEVLRANSAMVVVELDLRGEDGH